MPDFDTFITQLRTMFVELYPIISSEDWKGKGWTDEQRKSMNKFFHVSQDYLNDKLYPMYNRTIWDGHKDGTVKPDIKELRKETVRNGSNKTKPTAEELADQVLAENS